MTDTDLVGEKRVRPESEFVTVADDQIDSDGTCTMCRQPVGGMHLRDCVCRRRVVMVTLAWTVPVLVPADWTPGNIESRVNEGGYCADNAVKHVVARTSAARAAEAGHSPAGDGAPCEKCGRCFVANEIGCSCNWFEGEYVREATEQDEGDFGTVQDL